MKSLNKNVVIVVTVVVVLLALFSFKKFYLDASNTDNVHAEVTKQLEGQPTEKTPPPVTNGPAQTMPQTSGMRQPGNKGRGGASPATP